MILIYFNGGKITQLIYQHWLLRPTEEVRREEPLLSPGGVQPNGTCHRNVFNVQIEGIARRVLIDGIINEGKEER